MTADTVTAGNVSLYDRILGSLQGGAIGDAFGCPMECLHYREIRERFGDVSRFEDITADMMKEHMWFNNISMLGHISDDTAMEDILLDCIIKYSGRITAYEFAEEFGKSDQAVPNPDGDPVVRLNLLHYIEHIAFLRSKLAPMNRREIGHGALSIATGLYHMAPVGLLCAGDPARAELLAVDIASVNTYGNGRDLAGGYAAGLAACFLPGANPAMIAEVCLRHTRDPESVFKLSAMLDLARHCGSYEEFTERYYTEILTKLIPMQDWQHHGTRSCNTWDPTEVLGPALAILLLSDGRDGRKMIASCAKMGRDADTIARIGGSLLGAYRGVQCLPKDWIDFVTSKNRWLHRDTKARALSLIVRERLEESARVAGEVIAMDGTAASRPVR